MCSRIGKGHRTASYARSNGKVKSMLTSGLPSDDYSGKRADDKHLRVRDDLDSLSRRNLSNSKTRVYLIIVMGISNDDYINESPTWELSKGS